MPWVGMCQRHFPHLQLWHSRCETHRTHHSSIATQYSRVWSIYQYDSGRYGILTDVSRNTSHLTRNASHTTPNAPITWGLPTLALGGKFGDEDDEAMDGTGWPTAEDTVRNIIDRVGGGIPR
jgi:hypothetical protein